jgi:hypothetical protein
VPSGHGASKNKIKKWIEIAAKEGDSHSQVMLARMYHPDMSVPIDSNEARGWDEKADAQGNSDATAKLPVVKAEIAKSQVRPSVTTTIWLQSAPPSRSPMSQAARPQPSRKPLSQRGGYQRGRAPHFPMPQAQNNGNSRGDSSNSGKGRGRGDY